MQTRFQFHLSTALALSVIFGLFIPTIFHALGVGKIANEVVAHSFLAGTFGLMALVILKRFNIRDTVSTIMQISVVFGCMGLYLPIKESPTEYSGRGVPVALIFKNYSVFPNLMAPFVNVAFLFIAGIIMLMVLRLVFPTDSKRAQSESKDTRKE